MKNVSGQGGKNADLENCCGRSRRQRLKELPKSLAQDFADSFVEQIAIRCSGLLGELNQIKRIAAQNGLRALECDKNVPKSGCEPGRRRGFIASRGLGEALRCFWSKNFEQTQCERGFGDHRLETKDRLDG